jgi:hypothetical protein
MVGAKRDHLYSGDHAAVPPDQVLLDPLTQVPGQPDVGHVASALAAVQRIDRGHTRQVRDSGGLAHAPSLRNVAAAPAATRRWAWLHASSDCG